jgi:hypothetical protein
MDEFIERRIVTGLVVSTDYIRKVCVYWNDELLQSPELRRIAKWCFDYFEQYNKAPDTHIQDIYMDNLKHGRLSKGEQQDIAAILTRISDDFERGDQFNSAYLYDKTVQYFRSRELKDLAEQIDFLSEQGRTDEAEALRREFKPSGFTLAKGLELGEAIIADHIRQAFNNTAQSVLKYPGALGEVINDHLIRGGFVAWLAPEKRGKSFIMLDMGMRAIRQKSNVAFFQAGDMTAEQQLKRICIYLSRRSDKERYCAEHWRPTGDCIRNQLNRCGRPDRNCDHGIFGTDEVPDIEAYMDERAKFETREALIEKAERFPKYQPCESATCRQRLGTTWLVNIPECQPLTAEKAISNLDVYFKKYKRRFKLATYPSGTLTIDEMYACLEEWERGDDFVPDVILVDYADIMYHKERDFRHRQNEIWKGLRALSQEKHSLVVTATQADADSYTKDKLGLMNFSEDKRKYAHVTAMYGLNQDAKGREKKLGIMRINELVVREGDFDQNNQVYTLQDLWIGRPFLSSYFAVYYNKPQRKRHDV